MKMNTVSNASSRLLSRTVRGKVVQAAACRLDIPLRLEEDRSESKCKSNIHLVQQHKYHTSCRRESTTLVMSLGAIALTAKAGQYGLQAYQEYQQNKPPPSEESSGNTSTSDDSSNANAGTNNNEKAKRKNIFEEWFGVGVGSKYYQGGFEDKMTRREAALILGVRESSTAKRIKDAHRKILILNHPDTGGSTYIASKINEAKELLLKGKEN